MGFRKGGKARSAWQNIVRENEQWEKYYRAQGLPVAEEFEAFKTSFQKDLPLTFRITGSNKNALDVRNMMETRYIDTLKNIEWEGEVLQPPAPLAFYPDKMGWQVNVSKQVIRKNAEFSKFQRFLVVETTIGNISRQEAVSMIPPLLLDVQSHHTVLDTCASPGSKTAQLIEALHKGTDRPTGIVIANDADYKRSHMLTHQIKRLNSPNSLVTNHDAQLYPKIRLENGQFLKFDRILCDVPCSGDGTMRKNVGVWKEWTLGNGLGLHQLQLNIAVRGLQMLKAGGRLVYSTCSLNPIEDEAVVAQLLRQFPDVHLVDVSNELTGLVRSPGVSNWKVMAKDKTWQEQETSTLARSFFPPTEEEAAKFNLDRSIRVYPHQQDTGGFYIAVLEKAGGEPVEREAKRARVEEAHEDTPAPESVVHPDTIPTGDGSSIQDQHVKSKSLPRDAVEEPFHFLKPDHPTIDSLWEFYQIKNFPKDTLVVRNQTGEPVRTIYYVAPAIRPILELNENKLKFIHTGIKLFTQQKNEGPCKWRIQSEGVSLLYPSIGTPRVVTTSNLDTVKYLLEGAFPRFNELKEIDQGLHDQLIEKTEGCCLLNIDGVIYPLWRGKASVNIMLSKENAEEVLLRVFGISKNTKREAALKNGKNGQAAQAQEKVEETEEATEPAAETEETAAEETEAAEEAAEEVKDEVKETA